MNQVGLVRARQVAAGVLSILAAGFSSVASSASVHLVSDINQGTAASDPADFVDFDGRLLFTADDGVHGRELWQSDGTASGTQMIADLAPGASGSNPNNLFVGNGSLYFFALDSQGVSHLMRLASGSGATPVALTPMTSNACTQSVVLNGKLLFLASSGGYPYSQLWTSDGTSSGTVRIDDPSSTYALNPCYLQVSGNTLYFSGKRPHDGGNAIWQSDGTLAGTSLFAPSTNGIGAIYGLDNGILYFHDNTQNRVGGVYRADGTPTGTQQLLVSQEPRGNYPYGLFGLLGVTNGRPIALHTYVDPLTTFPETKVDLRLYFVDDPIGGGSPVPAAGFKQSHPTLVTSSHTLFMGADSGAWEPWVTDGTAAGTHIIRDFVPDGGPTVHWFAKYHDTYLIRLVDPNVGPQLWQTDTTSTGTQLVADVVAEPPTRYGTDAYKPAHGTGGADFYFVGRNDQLGNELYVFADDAPIASSDTGTSADGRAIQLSVLTNDSDPDGSLNSSSVRIVGAPSRGTVSVGADGVVTYTPNAGYSGSDSFSYTVADNLGKASAPATVALTITAAPQATPPRASNGGGGGAMRGAELIILLLLVALRATRSSLSPRARSS